MSPIALQAVPAPLASAHGLHLVVRLVHVLGVSILVGGAVLTWAVLARSTDGRRGGRHAVGVATSYEWLFWGAVGLVVMTGVGNLGAFAPNVPGPGTEWGETFAVKLLVVVGLLAFSAARTVLVRMVASRTESSRVASSPLGVAYALTAITLVIALGLAEVLAHG